MKKQMTDMEFDQELYEDAWGTKSNARVDCWACGGRGTSYEETCVTCGGYGWICD